MKTIDRIMLFVVVLSTIIIVMDAVTAHAYMLDILWWIRR